jgi:L-fuconate dehydratase
MPGITIRAIETRDARYTLRAGEGVDSVHSNPAYAYAVTVLKTDAPIIGMGLALTLGGGNDLVCQAILLLAAPLIGREIEDLMSTFGRTFRAFADHPQLGWLGPHKGVVHLALASIVNTCFDLWAKARGEPLWKLLLDLSPEQVIALLDLSCLENELTGEDARRILTTRQLTRHERANVLRARDAGFSALKIKVGSDDLQRDIRRVRLVREAVGSQVKLMVDCNQQWTLPRALEACLALAPLGLYWVEEPTHPDDVLAHQTLARAIAPVPIAAGEHIPNRVMFKNYMQAGAAKFIQVDCVRVGGISEFLTISLLARKFNLPVVPHVGDMGQLHQHLVLFNHIALDHPKVFLEHIPHLRQHFVHLARVQDGFYMTPQEPGAGSDLI